MAWESEFDWGSPEAEGAAPPDSFVEAFRSSMPSRYGVLFDPRTIRRHAGVAFRRGPRRAYAEVWRALADRTAALCVVSEDRPGLLSAIAAALVSHRLDVITALVFSRPDPGGEAEAVDLLWVRRASPSDTAVIGADEAGSVGEVLSAILAGRISVEEIASRAVLPLATPDRDLAIRFQASDEGGCAVLLVEAADRPGMLLTIAFALFQQGTQIVRSLIRTADGRAFNRFELVEFSGLPLAPERREQICVAVASVLTLRDVAAGRSGLT
jgi:[protein-PII] uridylyltransferase